jgi:hypothetical protein
MRHALVLPLILAGLTACATGPQERIARAEFACDDGRKLKVAFNLDKGEAQVRVDRSRLPPVILTVVPGQAGRNYAAAGYTLQGIGDTVTYATPMGSPARCVETR